MRHLFSAFAALALLVSTPAAAATPLAEIDPNAQACGDRLDLPAVENVMETKWSPDGHTLALVWFSQLPSRRSQTGYIERELVDSLDVATGRLLPIGVGDEPDWSGDGSLLSYWGPNAEDLRVTKGSLVVAHLTPSIPRVRWVGDDLYFVEKNEVRVWHEGVVRAVSTIEEQFVPKYPRDDVYFSADATHFVMSRYTQDGGLTHYLGFTDTGAMGVLSRQAGVRLMEWGPSGSVLLLRTLDRIEWRDFGTSVSRAVSIAGTPSVVHTWAPDGKSILLGSVSPAMPGGNAIDTFRRYDLESGGQIGSARLPNVLGERRLSPDGKYFVGVSRTGTWGTRLDVYRCAAGASIDLSAAAKADAAARQAKIDASTGRWLRPTTGEITQFITNTHTGVDVAAPFGEIITADDDGVITFVEWVSVGGNRVCVQHDGGLETCVYHTSAPLVTVGQRVARGQPIALIGMTGATTGPHTHWEAKLNGRIVDPLQR
jgi:murein DD-endopeptidase MepM/ murein hydrolase activator NlpD